MARVRRTFLIALLVGVALFLNRDGWLAGQLFPQTGADRVYAAAAGQGGGEKQPAAKQEPALRPRDTAPAPPPPPPAPPPPPPPPAADVAPADPPGPPPDREPPKLPVVPREGNACVLTTLVCRGDRGHSDQLVSLTNLVGFAMAAGCKIMRPKLCISPHYRLENLPMHNYFVSRDETADQIWIDKLPAYANASAPVPCFLSPADVEAQKGGGSKRRVNFRLFPPFDCRFPAATLPQNKDTLAETILPGGVYGIPEPHFMETPLLDRWVLEYANTEWLVPREEFFHVIRQIHDNPMFWRDKTDRPEDKWYYYSAHVRLSDLKIFCEVTASAASECGVDIAKVPAFLAAEIAAIEGPGRNYSSHIYIATDASSQEIAQLEDAFAALDPALVGPGLTVTISSADWYKALLYDVMKQIYPVYTVDQGGANYTTWERNMRHEKMMTIVLDQLMLGCGERMWGTRASGFSERAYQMGVHPYKLGMCGRNMPWGQRRRARDEKERMGYLPAVKDWKREPDPEASPTTAAAMTTNTAMAGK